ncbi:MAG TPA: hypothetical protein VM901_00845 [Bdellovibrionota bacterium]|nr:hypothetical protein [Bdellovibrionota bacterium]
MLLLAALAHGAGMGRFFSGNKSEAAPKREVGERREAERPAAVEPAQQPIERTPGFSSSPVVLGVDAKGNFGITSVDRNHETTKQWIKEGRLTEEQIRRIEGGEAVNVELPDAH